MFVFFPTHAYYQQDGPASKAIFDLFNRFFGSGFFQICRRKREIGESQLIKILRNCRTTGWWQKLVLKIQKQSGNPVLEQNIFTCQPNELKRADKQLDDVTTKVFEAILFFHADKKQYYSTSELVQWQHFRFSYISQSKLLVKKGIFLKTIEKRK